MSAMRAKPRQWWALVAQSPRRAVLAVACVLMGTAGAQPTTAQPLLPAGAIALPGTGGRIDHMAIDLKRGRVFVAELGNGTVDIVDLGQRKVIHRIAGLDEPQGVVYAPPSDRLVVSSGDGMVRIYDGDDFSPRGKLRLDDDADNARLDAASGQVIVGHGSGGVAIVDPVKAVVVADIRLPAHPEAFALSGGLAFVNVPDAAQIDVVDLAARKVVAAWKPDGLSSNFPMALDDAGHVAVIFRGQNRLALLDTANGHIAATTRTCGDADDVFFDAKRKRFYISCGSGEIDIVATANLQSLGRIATSWGARTSLFVPELDRLFVAERAGLIGSDAALAIFKPAEDAK